MVPPNGLRLQRKSISGYIFTILNCVSQEPNIGYIYTQWLIRAIDYAWIKDNWYVLIQGIIRGHD